MKKVLFAVFALTLFFSFTSSDLFAISWQLSQKVSQCDVVSSPPSKGGYSIQIKKVCGRVFRQWVIKSLQITIQKGDQKKTLELSTDNINAQSFYSIPFDGKTFSAKATFSESCKVLCRRSGRIGFKELMVDMKLE
jgi:hypothetical protein